jgi:putative DNA primase/helicase
MLGDVEATERMRVTKLKIENAERKLATDGDPVGAKCSSFAMTDLGNARRLAEQHHDTLQYCHSFKRWYCCDAVTRAVGDGICQVWRQDERGEADLAAKMTVKRIFAQADFIDESDRADDMRKWALRSQSQPRIASMLRLAQSEPRLVVTPDEMDTDPLIINTHSGIIDLSGPTPGDTKTYPNGDEPFLTRLAPVMLTDLEDCPTWLSFLNEIMGNDAELVGFLQRAVGYTLTGDVSERVMFVLHGTGANGKTVFMETLRAMLGTYAATLSSDCFVDRRNTIPNDIARLRGTRLVTLSETPENGKLNESMVKSLTGGDQIQARFLFGEYFEYRPTFKIWMATNHKPRIRGTDKGIWDRIRLIPFNVRIPDERQDKHLIDKLKAELPGIFEWALNGLVKWRSDGLSSPDAVTQATFDYRFEQDTLGTFLDEVCDMGETFEVSKSELYQRYKYWAEHANEKVWTSTAFGTRMLERGFGERRTKAARYWVGVRPTPQG